MGRMNQEHYKDPTPHQAERNIEKEKWQRAVKNPIHLIIPGEPVAQGRPKFTQAAGFPRAYDPPKSKVYKERIRSEAQAALWQRQAEKITGKKWPLRAEVRAYCSIPKSWSKRDQEDALNGYIWPTGRPDLDNYIKIALDALNEVLFPDDSQIVQLASEKRYSAAPRLEITIEVLPDERG